MRSLLYDSVTSSSWLDAASIFLVSSLSDGAACAAVASEPVITIAVAATTSARSLVRGCGTGEKAFLPLGRLPGRLTPVFQRLRGRKKAPPLARTRRRNTVAPVCHGGRPRLRGAGRTPH